ncbi:MAG: polysaccharide deacetylase family protein [Deltaproteobacteria bacterium]|nr:polysaccharide deacetylase family protein [Deltaproteobacteria bacterium]
MNRFNPSLPAIILVLVFAGCVTPPPGIPTPSVIRSSDFVILTAAEGDTIPSLAKDYLGDERDGWIIREYNKKDAISPGDEVVIPLRYDRRGGLYPDGYQTVPILVYHRFGEVCRDSLCVAADVFDEQMRFLSDNGYSVIALKDFYDFCRLEKTIPKKSVVLTVDDGYRSFYDVAWPILRKYGYTATLFVYTDFVESGKRALRWDELKELKEAGCEIESHSKSHADLTSKGAGMTPEQYLAWVTQELTAPKRIIEEHLDHQTVFLAYPFGRTNPSVVKAAENAGYLAAFTVQGRANPFFEPRYSISRTQVFNSTDIDEFRRRVTAFQEQDLRCSDSDMR